MVIRELQYEELSIIAKLDKEIYPIEGSWSLELFQKDFNSPNRYYLVAEDNGSIIGYAATSIDDGIADLTMNTVIPEYRNKGIGRKFLELRLKWIESKGVNEVFLHTRTNNEAIKNLVFQYGFKEVEIIKDYYPNGVEAIKMERKAQSL
jgi:ribosomal-protein-alanine acetyltransferase